MMKMRRTTDQAITRRISLSSTQQVSLVFVFTLLLIFQLSRLTENKSPNASPVIVEEHKSLKISMDRPRHLVTCDRSHKRYDICSINGTAVLDPATSTFHSMDQTGPAQPPVTEKIKPYPRKAENYTMTGIKEVKLTSGGPKAPSCQVHHNVPAIVFSAGGYTGNFFHDINDGFLPLYITVNSFFPGQEFVPVVSKARHWWVSKYAEMLKAFTKHSIVDMDNTTVTHCFPSVTVGLVSHGFMAINPTLVPNKKSLLDFQSFLGKAYGSYSYSTLNQQPKLLHRRPILVLASRSGTRGRVLLNQDQFKSMAEEEGFEVIIYEPKATTPLRDAYSLIHSSHALVGVHGAALTHLLFLRPGAVFIQIVVIGTNWVSEVCYGAPAKELGLEYMEYRIAGNESSLADKYGKDNILIKDPKALLQNGWTKEIMDKYLREQDVKLDLSRFREYLKNAYVKAKILLENEG